MADSKIAIVADIHGNMPALRAVIDDLGRQDPTEVIVAGDLVGRGPQGDQVVRKIRELGWRCVRGNHEDYLLGFVRREVPEPWWEAEEWAASRWMAAELSSETVDFIGALPDTLRPAGTSDLLVVHGSPDSNNEGLGPWSTDRQLAQHLAGIEESTLVCAHTHRPMVRDLPTGRVVNVGSVGLPFNRDQRAQYALLEHGAEGWKPDLRGVDYDTDELLSVYETSGFAAAGGVTVELLRLEVRHAAPFLVPFLGWARVVGREPASDQVPDFLELYDPGEPLHDFFLRLEAMRAC